MESDIGLVHVTNYHGTRNNMHGTSSRAIGDSDYQLEEHLSDEAADIGSLTKSFVSEFRIKNNFLYMDMLRGNLAAGLFFIEVQMSHLQQYSGTLSGVVQYSPTRTLPRMEHAICELAQTYKLFPRFARQGLIQVQLFWGIPPTALRSLAQAAVAQLVCVSGIVIKTSAAHARCVRAAIQCTSCRSQTVIAGGGRGVELPPHCLDNGGARPGARCRPHPYVLLPAACEFEDQQLLKLQELPEDVPTGELPRQLGVVVDRYLVDRVSPGARVQVAGVVAVQERRGGIAGSSRRGTSRVTAGLRAQYLRGVGLMFHSGGDVPAGAAVVSVNENFSSRVRSRSALVWQPEEEALFKAFAKSGNVYETLSRSIDPAIFGLNDQKKAIVCLLFSGTRKRQGNNYLRGDMNVLFIGDPSTAKSQLLKYTEKVAPIGIYTSGKGSSAAGLTASVISNGNGDFVLEAGSMVLADGGVICIDEFDKMRDQDQVAIHEAMEQPTISIAKANLTTMLNSRTSVLAAANPTLGSYDPLRSNEDQMDFQSAILSRFDLIFRIIDPHNPEVDSRLAHHVVNLHRTGRRGPKDGGADNAIGLGPTSNLANETVKTVDGITPNGVVDRLFFTKYISYARATCHSVISEDAMTVLLDFYVQVRRDVHRQTLETLSSSSPSLSGGGVSSNPSSKGGAGFGGAKPQMPIIQITARQLESLVRITESLAKMRLDVLATRMDAEEAIRLFKFSTVDAIHSRAADQILTEAQGQVILRIEEALRRRLTLGATVEYRRLISEMVRMGLDGKMVDRALYAMTKREELEWRKQRTLLYRVR
ncbi:unnamed protein product [Phytomonas sp. Hart1]|nr:unnamed protein product [Phytomonas sp. Hart1]|eukprot:CCW66043.1 unnamed protein product [Phytomonas sp. isolate Hart1]